MKKLLILLAFTSIIACNKDKNNPQAKATSGNDYEPHWIPYWYPGDTLLGWLGNDSTTSAFLYDTMITATFSDTSCIFYKGAKLYVWTSPYYNTAQDKWIPFEDGDKIYHSSYIGTIPFDTVNGVLDHGQLTSVRSHKYLHPNGVDWEHQKQSIFINSYLNFEPVFLNFYESKRKY